MPLEPSLWTLLHLLVFAYWLGGDIGVFYASTLLTDEKRDTSGRLAAAKIVADVDLAPRFCLLLTFPTGLALADAKGWLQLPEIWLVVAFIVALSWIWLVWRLHVRHGKPDSFKRADTLLRYLFLAALWLTGVAGLATIPLFISLKLIVLGFAVLMGLIVRSVLTPFGPAMAALASGNADAATNEAIKAALGRARPAVVAIWIALVIAAWLGITTPV